MSPGEKGGPAPEPGRAGDTEAPATKALPFKAEALDSVKAVEKRHKNEPAPIIPPISDSQVVLLVESEATDDEVRRYGQLWCDSAVGEEREMLRAELDLLHQVIEWCKEGARACRTMLQGMFRLRRIGSKTEFRSTWLIFVACAMFAGAFGLMAASWFTTQAIMLSYDESLGLTLANLIGLFVSLSPFYLKSLIARIKEPRDRDRASAIVHGSAFLVAVGALFTCVFGFGGGLTEAAGSGGLDLFGEADAPKDNSQSTRLLFLALQVLGEVIGGTSLYLGASAMLNEAGCYEVDQNYTTGAKEMGRHQSGAGQAMLVLGKCEGRAQSLEAARELCISDLHQRVRAHRQIYSRAGMVAWQSLRGGKRDELTGLSGSPGEVNGAGKDQQGPDENDDQRDIG